ncbi:Retrotransposon gag protein [Corchorus capsularis]|uniref:Retrotransposon gag protein n=1 Tax=Corchorus capsularis TaxID=210143 RepID=A0A1R3FXM5_COCAP|nr:Retrotransposon gag protein [Corchorus capsularis]
MTEEREAALQAEIQGLQKDQGEMKEQLDRTKNQMDRMMGMMESLTKRMKGKANQEEQNPVSERQKMVGLGMDDGPSNAAQTTVSPTTQTLPTSSPQSLFPPQTSSLYPYPPYLLPYVTQDSGAFKPRAPTDTSFMSDPNTMAIKPIEIPVAEKSKKDTSEDSKRLFNVLEEMIKGLEGPYGYYDVMDASELSLVSGLVVPEKFKVPEFEKFDGTKNPQNHLRSYARKMHPHTQDDKLLIHCFQFSLTDSASVWYNQLDPNKINSWTDLAKAFMTQYRYMLDLAPTRESLRNMERKPSETWKEYAQRWRDAASQVQSSIPEQELTSLFLQTLKPIFFEKLFHLKRFAEVVVAGEMLESGLNSGKIDGGEAVGFKKGQGNKKKETEVNVASQEGYQPKSSYGPYYPPLNYCHPYHYPINYYQPPSNTYQYPYPSANNVTSGASFMSKSSIVQPSALSSSLKAKERTPIEPIPYTYTELLLQLLQQGLVTRIQYTKTWQPPYPKWYDVNAYCDFHSGAQGHSTENCTRLKYVVQDLVKSGKLSFSKEKS